MQIATPSRFPLMSALVCITAVYAVIAGCSALLGWYLEVPRLTDWTNEGISMFPNAALCGVLCGLALLGLTFPRTRLTIWAVRLLASLIILVAFGVLFEHVSDLNIGIDTLLVQRPWGQTAAASPMRMGVPASTAYLILGIALWLANAGGDARFSVPLLATLTLGIAALSLIGYLFGADQLFGIAKISGIAWLTSTVVASLSVGTMAVVPDLGLLGALSRPDAGGAVLRRLILPIVLIPLLLGWLRILGEEIGYFDHEFGTALRTLAEIAVFLMLLWWTANNISWHASSAEKAQTRLAAIIEYSDDAIVSKSLDGVIESWNNGAERTFGYSEEEAVGRNISLIIPPDRISEETDILQRIRRGERIEHFQTERVRKDGQRIYVSLTVSPVKDSSGTIVGVSKIARDISEQRRAEERFRAVVEATPECVTIVAPDGSLEFMNHAGFCMMEYETDQFARGASAFELIAPEHSDEWLARHRRICAGERMSWEFEIIGRKGTRRWMETHAVPLELPDGRTAQLAVTREITSRKQYEQEREALIESERAARSVAERASHLKDEFLATLSHELRTPLNAILGWAHVLKRTRKAEDLDQGLEVIERNAKAQAQLIEDLLDMNRIISGKMRLDVQSTDLAAIIAAAVQSTKHAADAKEITLRTILDPRAGTVSGDATRLQQIIWNLLSNAIKFTPKGGKVDVLLERVNSHVEVTVRDSGIGIPEEHLPYIFERFRQVDSSTTRVHGGLGLGLSIVKHLVELHGGTIHADSAGKDQGTTIVVKLPLSPIRTDLNRIHPTAATSTSIDYGHLLGGVKVLVVDDEADARTLIERVLTQCGAEVRVADSASQGMEALRSFRPQVLVSDIGMPGTDGYQFMRDVRKLSEAEGGRTPAIALTAFARSEDRMRAMLSGYQIHVSKPIEPQELAIIVHSLTRPLDASSVVGQPVGSS